MALLPEYRYGSLESNHDNSSEATTTSTKFRFLVLDTGSPDDEVSCTLAPHTISTWHQNMKQCRNVWGDPTDTCELICSGQRLAITKSLGSALRRFRYTSRKRMLWADAICINQGDLDERSAQVSIMSKIYSQARQVLIWLGEETGYNSEALYVFSQLETILLGLPARHSDEITDIVALVMPELVMHIKACLPEGSQRQIAYLLSKPWFRRVWIIQEVVMARTAQIFIGSRSLAWSIFINVVERIVLYQLEFMFVSPVRNAQTALPNIVNLMHPGYTEACGPFFRLLCLARNFQSTDPRDKLYALLLLGISDSDAMSSKSVDYTIPVSNVFIQYTKRELVSSSLAHLSATNYTDDVAQVILPTWVPDWSRPVDRVPFEVVGATFNAGGTTIRRLDSSCDSKLLKIDGKKVSSITRLGTTRINELEPLLLSTEEGGWGSQSA